MSLSKLQELVMDRDAWHVVVHVVTESRTLLSNWTELKYWFSLLNLVPCCFIFPSWLIVPTCSGWLPAYYFWSLCLSILSLCFHVHFHHLCWFKLCHFPPRIMKYFPASSPYLDTLFFLIHYSLCRQNHLLKTYILWYLLMFKILHSLTVKIKILTIDHKIYIIRLLIPEASRIFFHPPPLYYSPIILVLLQFFRVACSFFSSKCLYSLFFW